MTNKIETTELSRRKMLARLGLALGAAYVVPVLTQIGSAEAASRPDKPSKASRPDKPSKPSRPAKPSKPSRPRGLARIFGKRDG